MSSPRNDSQRLETLERRIWLVEEVLLTLYRMLYKYLTSGNRETLNQFARRIKDASGRSDAG